MSSNKFDPKLSAIRFDPSGVFAPLTGISRDEQVALTPSLEAARAKALADLERWRTGGEGEPEHHPSDLGFIDRPERLLAEYGRSRAKSELGRVLAAAKRLRDSVDRVVVVGPSAAIWGARLLFATCCHPYHNEQGRGDRGGRPRIYFAGETFENDALQGLLDLLTHGGVARTIDERWAIIAIDDDGESPATAAALRTLLARLRQACDGDEAALARLIVPVVGSCGWLAELARSLGCMEVFEHSCGADGLFAAMSPVGLFPASVMGLNIVRLLEGGAAMNERFRTAPVGDNPVLDYVAGCQLAAGLAPREQLVVNLIVDDVRRDRLVIEPFQSDRLEVDPLAGKAFPALHAETIERRKQAIAAAGRPTADLHLAALDEAALGQMFQMFILAAVVEEKLGIKGGRDVRWDCDIIATLRHSWPTLPASE